MKALRIFSLAFCLSACQSAQQPAPTMSTAQPGRASSNQQELSFLQPRNHFRFSLSEEGNGIFVTGARESAEPLGIHIINRFVLQDEFLNYPSLTSRQAADYTSFLSPQQGQGQIIAVNTPSAGTSGVITADETPPQNAPLEIRTITLSDFKPDGEPTTLTFSEQFSGIKLGQKLVDASGNGYVYLLQTNGVPQVHPISLFAVDQAQILQLPPLAPDHFVISDFKGDQGTLVEVPNTPLNRSAWEFKVHHLDQGQLRDSRTLSYPLGATEIPALGVGLSITPQGDGLFAWST